MIGLRVRTVHVVRALEYNVNCGVQRCKFKIIVTKREDAKSNFSIDYCRRRAVAQLFSAGKCPPHSTVKVME